MTQNSNMAENRKLNAEEMIIKSSFQIKQEFPYYSIVYTCMDRVIDKNIDTMGVSEDTIAFNPEFVEGLSIAELNFTNMHEIAHVALKHVTLGKGKDHKLWNIAADLIVNKFIINELTQAKSQFSRVNPYEVIRINDREFKMPEGCLYCDSLDLEVDSVHSLYSQLYKQAQSNGYLEDANKLQPNDLDENGETIRNYEFSIKGSGDSNGEYGEYKFNINVNYVTDLTKSTLSEAESDLKSNNVLNRVKVKSALDGVSAGIGGGNLSREVEKGLKSELDWKRYVQKFCVKLNTKDSSFKNPDKRMYYQRAIYPGNITEESNYLKGIKVCVDTSGSISEDDFSYFMGQLEQLLSKYKVEAEVIYWDGEIESKGEFKNYKELRRVKALGGGGTDVSCVFEYLKSKKCKIKPVLTIIFTDGYFGANFETDKNKRMFRDTLWIMTRSHDRSFKPAFGVVAVPKFPNNDLS